MTIKQALQFRPKSTSPALDSEVLLSFVLKKPRAYLFTYPEKILTKSQENQFKKLIALRNNNWPVAYLTHIREFFGLNFYIDKNVLVPRAWTESLVADAVGALRGRSDLKILDVGTGSGAIIVSLAKTLGSGNDYYAVDISPKALAVAKKNAKRHGVKITFKKSDLLKNIHDESDVVTANLPYLDRLRSNTTKREPKIALVIKDKGLRHYINLLQQLSTWKKHPELLFIECEPQQEKTLQAWATKLLPHTQLRVTKDSSAITK